jgi:hypothetical protein
MPNLTKRGKNIIIQTSIRVKRRGDKIDNNQIIKNGKKTINKSIFSIRRGKRGKE